MLLLHRVKKKESCRDMRRNQSKETCIETTEHIYIAGGFQLIAFVCSRLQGIKIKKEKKNYKD